MTTTAYSGIDGHLNFNIPRVKRKLVKDNLTSLDLESRDAKEILTAVRHSYLEPNYSGNLSLKSVDSVVNKQLEDAYREKKYELKEEGRHSKDLTDQYVFLACKDPNVPSYIAKNGIRATEKADRILNVLGNSKSGVSLWKHADVQISLAETYPAVTECKILMFKVVVGKCKSIQPCYGSETVIEPTPNYDCHISGISARIGDPFYPKLMKSQIFFYEYTDEALPSPTPRQCLPYAVLTYARPAHTAPVERSPLKTAYNNFYKSFKGKADLSNKFNSEDNSDSLYGRKNSTGRVMPPHLQYNGQEGDPRLLTLPVEQPEAFVPKQQSLLPDPHQVPVIQVELPTHNAQEVDLRVQTPSIEALSAKKQPLLPDPVVLSVNNIESPELRPSEPVYTSNHLSYSAYRRQLSNQGDPRSKYSDQTAFVASVSTSTVRQGGNSSMRPGLLPHPSATGTPTGSTNLYPLSNEEPPDPRLVRQGSQNATMTQGQNFSAFTPCEFSSSSDNEIPSSLQRNTFFSSPNHALPNSYASVPVNTSSNSANHSANSQSVVVNKLQQTITDSHLEMLKKALSTSQGTMSNVPNSPVSSNFSSPQSSSGQSAIFSPEVPVSSPGSAQFLQGVRPKAGKQKLSLESYRQKKRHGSALLTPGLESRSDKNAVFETTEQPQSQQPPMNIAENEKKLSDTGPEPLSGKTFEPANPASTESKPRGILKRISKPPVEIKEEKLDIPPDEVKTEVNDNISTASTQKMYSPDSPTSTTSSVYSGDTSSVTSSLAGTRSHCPSPIDSKSTVKKKKKINRDMIGYKKRRRRKGNKGKAKSVPTPVEEPSAMPDVPGDEKPVSVLKDRVNPLWLFSSPVRDSEIEYNDFSFDLPSLFQMSDLVLNDDSHDNVTEQADVPMTLPFSTPSFTLESYSLQHWSQAVTDKRFQPKLILSRVQMDAPQVQKDDVSSDDDTLVIDIEYEDSLPKVRSDSNIELSYPQSLIPQANTFSDGDLAGQSMVAKVPSSNLLSQGSPDKSLPNESLDIDAVIDRDMRQGSTLLPCPDIKLERPAGTVVNFKSQMSSENLPLNHYATGHPSDQFEPEVNAPEETLTCPLTLYSPESPTDAGESCELDLFSPESPDPSPPASESGQRDNVTDMNLNQSENEYEFSQVNLKDNVVEIVSTAPVTESSEVNKQQESLLEPTDDVTLQAIHQVAVNILPFMKGNSQMSISEISQTIATILSSAHGEGMSTETPQTMTADKDEPEPVHSNQTEWSEHQSEKYPCVQTEPMCTELLKSNQSTTEPPMKNEAVKTRSVSPAKAPTSGDVNDAISDLNSSVFMPTTGAQSDALYSAYTHHASASGTLESAEQTAAKWLGQMARLCNVPKNIGTPKKADFIENVQANLNVDLPTGSFNTKWNTIAEKDMVSKTLLSGEDIHSSVMKNLEETAFRLSNTSSISSGNKSKSDVSLPYHNTPIEINSADQALTCIPSGNAPEPSLQKRFSENITNEPVVSQPNLNIHLALSKPNLNNQAKETQNEDKLCISKSVQIAYQGNLITVPVHTVISGESSKRSKRKKTRLSSEMTEEGNETEHVHNLQTGVGLEEQSQNLHSVKTEYMEPKSSIHIEAQPLRGTTLAGQQSDDNKGEIVPSKTAIAGQNDILKWFEDMINPKECPKKLVKKKKSQKKQKVKSAKETLTKAKHNHNGVSLTVSDQDGKNDGSQERLSKDSVGSKKLGHDLSKSKERLFELRKQSRSKDSSVSPERYNHRRSLSRRRSARTLNRHVKSRDRSPRDLKRSNSREKSSLDRNRKSSDRSVHKSSARSMSRDRHSRKSTRSRDRSRQRFGDRRRSRSSSRSGSWDRRSCKSTRRSRSRLRSRSRSRHSFNLKRRSRSREQSCTTKERSRDRVRSKSKDRRSHGLQSRSSSRGRSRDRSQRRTRSRDRFNDRSARSRFSRSFSYSLSLSPKRRRADDSMSISSFSSSSSHRWRSSSRSLSDDSRNRSYHRNRTRSSSHSPERRRLPLGRSPSDKRHIDDRYNSSWLDYWTDRPKQNPSPNRSSRYHRSRSKSLLGRAERKRSSSVKRRESNQSPVWERSRHRSLRSGSKSRMSSNSPKYDRDNRHKVTPLWQKCQDSSLDSKERTFDLKTGKEASDYSRHIQKYDQQESKETRQESIRQDQIGETRKDSKQELKEKRSEPKFARQDSNRSRRSSKESRSEFKNGGNESRDSKYELKTNRRESVDKSTNKSEIRQKNTDINGKQLEPKEYELHHKKIKNHTDSKKLKGSSLNMPPMSPASSHPKHSTSSSQLTAEEALSERERIFEEMCLGKSQTTETKRVQHQRVRELSSTHRVEAKTLDDLASDRARILSELNGLNSDSESVSSQVSQDDKQSPDSKMTHLLRSSPVYHQAGTSEPLFEEALGVVVAPQPRTPREDSSHFNKHHPKSSQVTRKKSVEIHPSCVPYKAVKGERSGEQDRKKVGAAWGQIVSNIHLEKQERLKGTRAEVSSVFPAGQLQEDNVNTPDKSQSSTSVADLFAIECQETLAKIQKTKRKSQLEREQLAQSAPISKWFSVFVAEDCKAYDLLLFRLCKKLGIVSSVKFSELSKNNRKNARKTAEDMSFLVNSILNSSLCKLSLPDLQCPKSSGKTLSQWLALGIDSHCALYKRVLYEICLEVAVPSYQLVASLNTVMANKLKEYVYYLLELIATLKQPREDLSESTNASVHDSSMSDGASSSKKKEERNVQQICSDSTEEEFRTVTSVVNEGRRCKSCGRYSDILGLQLIIASLGDIKRLLSRANSFFVEYVEHMKVIMWNAKVFKTVRFNLDTVLTLLSTVNSLPSDIKKHIPLLTPASENIAKVLHMTKFLYFKKRELQIRLVISMMSSSETLLAQALSEAESKYQCVKVPGMRKCEDFKTCPECVLYLQGSQNKVQSEEFILLDPSYENNTSTDTSDMQPTATMDVREPVPDVILLTFKNIQASIGGGLDDCKWKGTGKFDKIPDHLLLPAEINSGVLYGGRSLYFTRNLRDKVAKQLVRCKKNITRINKCLAMAPNPDQEKAKVRMLNLRWNLLTRYTTKLCDKKYQELLRYLDKFKSCLEWHGRVGYPEIEIFQTDAMATLIKTYIERIPGAIKAVEDGMARLEAEKTRSCDSMGTEKTDQSDDFMQPEISAGEYASTETDTEGYLTDGYNQQKMVLWNKSDKPEDPSIEITYFTSDDTALVPNVSRRVEPLIEDSRQVLAVESPVDPLLFRNDFEEMNRGLPDIHEGRQVVYGSECNQHGDVDLRQQIPPANYRTIEYPVSEVETRQSGKSWLPQTGEWRRQVDTMSQLYHSDMEEYYPVSQSSSLAYNTPDTLRDAGQYEERYVHDTDSRGWQFDQF